MSFDVRKWLTDPSTCSDMPLYLFEDENVTALVEAVVEAYRAEAEAEITALQAERDKLREALLPFKPDDKDAFAYMELAHSDKPRKYPITVTDRDLLRVHSLLSTPASGQPVRKP